MPDAGAAALIASPCGGSVTSSVRSWRSERALAGLATRIHDRFKYDGSATTVDTTPAEAFEKRHGVCQDFAQIMIAGLRGVGLPAAYISGYLRTVPPPGKPRLVGADATHAWVALWCGEELGWIGFDPTNNCLVRTDHIDANDQVRLLCPLERPRIFGVGFNYAAHAKETGQALPTRAATFMKPDSAAIGPDEAIIYPFEGQRVDFECELAVIIGRGGRRIAREDVDQHIFGFTCANDVSERPIQFDEMAAGCLLIGKGFDTFCPLGPVIATGLNHWQLAIATRLNGEVKQSSNTADLVFDVAHLVSYISQAITLRPGDVIITGTPEGIGPMRPGDVVEVEIEGIGVLRNPVVAESR